MFYLFHRCIFLLQSVPFSVSTNGIKCSLRLSNPLDKDLKHQSDEELLRVSREGNVAAFGELVRRYESKVAATVIGMLGKCDEADDIGQETFIRFYHALKSFRGDSSIGTYITRIAMNLSLNEIRRRERRRFLFKRIDPENETEEPAVENGADHLKKRKSFVERWKRSVRNFAPSSIYASRKDIPPKKQPRYYIFPLVRCYPDCSEHKKNYNRSCRTIRRVFDG